MGLKEEINDKRKQIVVDSYPMSIGEMMNLYKEEMKLFNQVKELEK